MARIALTIFGTCFLGILILANQGRGFWGFLDGIPLGDKLGHLGLVGTLALLLNLSLRNRRLPRPMHAVMLGSALVAGAMTAEELSQCLLPQRTADLLDGVTNLLAAGLGQLAAMGVEAIRRHRRLPGQPG